MAKMSSSANSESRSEVHGSTSAVGILSYSSHDSTPIAPTSPTYTTKFSPRPWYRPRVSLRAYALVALPLLSLLGAFGTWNLGRTNGTFKLIFELIAEPEAQLPGTDEDLIKIYTGLGFLDHQLQILVTFFAPLVGQIDHENGALHLFSVFGTGQFGAVWCLIVMESLRIGNRGRIVGFGFIGIVGLIFQNITYTVTMPLWLFIHMLTSPVAKLFPGTHSNSVLLIPAWDLHVLPVSVTLGYLIPTILMGLESDAIEPETHQYLIAFWQAFPVWTVIAHYVLRSVYQFAAKKLCSDDSGSSSLGSSYLNNVKHVYRFILALCITTHIPVLLITLLPTSIFPLSMPSLAMQAQNTLLDVYVPYFPVPVDRQVANLTEGVHTFLIWDLHVGSIAFLLWAILLYRNAMDEKAIVDPGASLPVYGELLLDERDEGSGGWTSISIKIAMWTIVSGPIGALAMLLWERDTIVRQKVKQGI